MIEYRNNRLYNVETNNYLTFINTISKDVGGIRMISYQYEDKISQQKFTYTNQQLIELKRLGDNNIQVY